MNLLVNALFIALTAIHPVLRPRCPGPLSSGNPHRLSVQLDQTPGRIGVGGELPKRTA